MTQTMNAHASLQEHVKNVRLILPLQHYLKLSIMSNSRNGTSRQLPSLGIQTVKGLRESILSSAVYCWATFWQQ